MTTKFVGDKLKPFKANELLADAIDVEYEVTDETNTNLQTEVENTLNSASINGQVLTLMRRGGQNPLMLTLPTGGATPNLYYNRVSTTATEVVLGFVAMGGITPIMPYSYIIVENADALISIGYLQTAASQGAYWILHNNTTSTITIRGSTSQGAARAVRIRGSTSALMNEISIPPQQTFFFIAETFGGTSHDYYKIDCLGRIDGAVGGRHITATTENNIVTFDVDEEATHFTAVQGTAATILIGYDVNLGIAPVKPYSYLYVTNNTSLLSLDFLRNSGDQGAFWFIRNATDSNLVLRGRMINTPTESVKIIGATEMDGRQIQIASGEVYLLIAQSFSENADHFYLAQPLSKTDPTELYYNMVSTASNAVYCGFVNNGNAVPTIPYSYIIVNSPQAVISIGYLQSQMDGGAFWLLRNNSINLLRIQGLTTAGANRHVRFRIPSDSSNQSEIILPPGQLFIIVAETYGGTGHDYYRVNCLGRLDSVSGDGDIVTQTQGNNSIVGIRENYKYFLPADGTTLTTYFGFVNDAADNPPILPYTYTQITNTFTTATIGFMQKPLDEGAFWLLRTTGSTAIQLTGNSVSGQVAMIDGATQLGGRRISLLANQMYLLMARDYNATGNQYYIAHCLGRLDQVIGGYNTQVVSANSVTTINQSATPIVLIRENNFVMSVLTLPETIASNRVTDVSGDVNMTLPATMSTTVGKKLTVINGRAGVTSNVRIMLAVGSSFLNQGSIQLLDLAPQKSVTLFCPQAGGWELVSTGQYSDVS